MTVALSFLLALLGLFGILFGLLVSMRPNTSNSNLLGGLAIIIGSMTFWVLGLWGLGAF